MAWRALLSNRPIRRVDLLACKPAALAAWTHRDRVTVLDLQHGAKIDELIFEEPGGNEYLSAPWRTYVASLKAPGDVTLPVVRAGKVDVRSSKDGHMRLYRAGDGALTVEASNALQPLALEADTTILAMALSANGALVALLDRKGRLHLYQGHVRTGVFEVGLHPLDELAPALAVTDDGTRVIASDGLRLSVVDEAGRIIRRTETPYPLGTLACSGDGKWLVTTDLESNVIRAYASADLTVTHQRFVVDLLADARRAQVLPVAVTTGAAVGPITINARGVVAFATSSGLVCATSLTRMKPVPRSGSN
ncbi:MAG TPA: hypothetical protein VER79_14415 [Candidatus Limnocylindrales bacterium]|nr:hypothetical protein [Candidatus Limnocylindrales bacterium]